jgi:hypothetical protein
MVTNNLQMKTDLAELKKNILSKLCKSGYSNSLIDFGVLAKRARENTTG